MLFAEIFELKKEDYILSHKEFIAAAGKWKKMHYLDNWVNAKHLLSFATAYDIDLLLEVRAFILMRVSPDCLYEVHEIDTAIFLLGRSRYRKVSWISEKVEER